MYFVFVSYLPTAADSAGPRRARSQDCWPRRAGWSDAPVLEADSPTTKVTQSSQAETVWFYGKGGKNKTEKNSYVKLDVTLYIKVITTLMTYYCNLTFINTVLYGYCI